MRPRGVSLLLVVAGGMLVFAQMKRLVSPGLTEFLFITIGHLLIAIAVVGLARLAIRGRALGLTLGILWGIGWMALFVREASMMLFLLPPEWLSYGDWLLLFGGVGAGVAGIVQYRESTLAELACPSWLVLVFAVLSSLFVWFGFLLGDLGVTPEIVNAVRVAEETLLALSLLATGVVLLALHRRHRRSGHGAPDTL